MRTPASKPPRSPRQAATATKDASQGHTAPTGEDAARQVARTAAQEVRILGGQWKRTPLPVPVSAGLRPTPSRVRETLFNWLGQDLSGWRVLDAFAGSGALGLEAASRGAESLVLLERDTALVRNLRAVQQRLKAEAVQVVQGDALSWMRQAAQAGRFDLVFLDPPFEDGQFIAATEAAIAAVAPGGWLYLESPKPWAELLASANTAPETLRALRLHREGRAGAVHFHLFQCMAEA